MWMFFVPPFFLMLSPTTLEKQTANEFSCVASHPVHLVEKKSKLACTERKFLVFTFLFLMRIVLSADLPTDLL